MSNIEVITHHLTPVNYQDIIEKIAQVIQQGAKSSNKDDKFLPISPTAFSFDLDKIAKKVSLHFAGSNNYPFELRDGLRAATIHTLDLEEKETFSANMQQLIIQELRKQVQEAIETSSPQRPTLEQYMNELLTPLETFQGQKVAGLAFPLGKTYDMEKKRLHIQEQKPKDQAWLKAHKITLTVRQIGSIDQQIIASICDYIKQHPKCDDDDLEDVQEVLEEESRQPGSDLNQLRDILIKESVARIYRDAKIRYLRYILTGVNAWKKREIEQQGMNASYKNRKEKEEESKRMQTHDRGRRLLHHLILRLQGLDAYIRQSGKEVGYYQVLYQGNTFNYRDLFSRADAFDCLPIIPEFDGFLGESTDKVKSAKTFVSGVKLKLNGAVNVHGGNGLPVFEYNLALLDPTSPAYQARQQGARSQQAFQEKVLKVALLYCFVFKGIGDKDFRAGTYFEENILPVLRSGDAQGTIAALQQLHQDIDTEAVKEHIEALCSTLFDFLTQSSIGPEPHTDTLYLNLNRNIMTNDVNLMITNNIFFQETFDSRNGRNALKYIAIKEDAADSETICTLPLTMTFEPLYYHAADETSEMFQMSFETQGIQVLPIFFAPVDKKSYIEKYAETYKSIKRLVFYYRHHPQAHADPSQAFVYRFTYTLLSYVFLKILIESVSVVKPRQLFCPLLCIHAEKKMPDEKNEKYDDEAFMHALSKILAHMLGEDCMSGSQGFYLDTVQGKGSDFYKLQNALYSLYSVLPHTFRQKSDVQADADHEASDHVTTLPHQLNKLAIIVVSSRKCDENKKSPEYYKATILGKMIGVERQTDGRMQLATLGTFSENQDSMRMYSQPEAIIEQVKHCFQQGYQNFLYVARAPYTSTLHISDSDDEELFFMNSKVIRSMRDVDKRIRVYPVFCDKYYVINHKQPPKRPGKANLQVDSLYIDDIAELKHIASDQSRRSLIFFNLFSGIRVNPKAVYNGVMSYATLINVYEDDPTYDRYIWSDILSETSPRSAKETIIDFLTLLHFVRYQKSSQPGFKLDPYTDIIGDNSVGKMAVFPHMNGLARFNALLFLTLVRAIFHVTP